MGGVFASALLNIVLGKRLLYRWVVSNSRHGIRFR